MAAVGTDPDPADVELRDGDAEIAVLVENLDPIVLTVAHKQPPTPIHGKRVRRVELAGRQPILVPGS